MMSLLPIRRSRKRAGAFVLFALTLCFPLVWTVEGCKENPPAGRQVTRKVVSPPAAPAPETPQAKTTEPPTETAETLPMVSPEENPEPAGFRPKSERDPFKSFITTRTAVPARAEQTPKIKTPLQRYSLDQLKVVGIISGGKMRKALLEDDVGKGYVVSKGDFVGSEGGRIVAIKKDSIIIESTYRDVLGNKKVRRITKKLYVSEEGENP